MARKASIKQITDGINTVAENYFRASNAKNISDSTRAFLTAKWACYREVAVILAIKNQSDLATLVDGSTAWKRDAHALRRAWGLTFHSNPYTHHHEKEL